MGTISEREGLLAPAFCALSVRSVRSVAVGGAATGNSACPSLACVPYGVVGESVSVGLAALEARVCWMPGWGILGGVSVCPSGSDSVASSGGGEPWGSGGRGMLYPCWSPGG